MFIVIIIVENNNKNQHHIMVSRLYFIIPSQKNTQKKYIFENYKTKNSVLKQIQCGA